MIKKIIAGLCLVFSTIAFSQENNASPYSFYGIGDAKFKGTAENRSMGGLGILPDSIHLNLQNPATYSALKLTTWTVGATNSRTTLKTAAESADAGRTSIDYLAMALPFKKLAVSFGIMPYTATGYRIQRTEQEELDATRDITTVTRFLGSGGLNRVYGGASYKVNKNFGIGANVSYYFGDIETQSLIEQTISLKPLTPGDTVSQFPMQYATREVNTSRYHALGVDIGAYYQTTVNSKYTWTTSATFTPETTLRGNTRRTVATVFEGTDGSFNVIDDREYTNISADNKIPMKITAGTGFGLARKWFAGIEYTHMGNSALSNRFDGVSVSSYKNGQKITVGGYYIPNYFSYTSYLSRITYRGGLRYENTGLVVNGQDINDMGVSLGIGLPLSGTIGGSNLNIGAEYGQRGTTSAGLIKENYFSIFIGLSLNDKWFVKRKYE
ncbi:hypothetical protein ACLI09_10785 [Flavobacterium sp. RHBU_24]|uniref:hypothetical protein n=1 Tax=Flavobacterium sp. RHBU_24 TaxID=3391185 RepID=UPI0039853CEE